jgi:hypothetical protein
MIIPMFKIYVFKVHTLKVLKSLDIFAEKRARMDEKEYRKAIFHVFVVFVREKLAIFVLDAQ